MGKYTFVTESHLSGDDKQTVEILSRRDVEEIADKSAEQAFDLLRREFEQERDRLSKRIERAAKTVGEAKQAAEEAQITAETKTNRLVEESGDVFRGIVEDSLRPLLDSGLKQVLDNQKNIQKEHKSLLGDITSLRVDCDAARQAAETHLRDLAEENQRLRDEMNRFQADTAGTQEGEAIEQVAFPDEIRQLQDEIKALRGEVAELRPPDRKPFPALEDELQNIRAELSELQRKTDTLKTNSPAVQKNKNTALWVVAILALLLALGGFSGGCPSEPSSPVASTSALERKPGEASAISSGSQSGQGQEQTGGNATAALLLLARVGDEKAQICLGKMHVEGLSVGGTDEEAVLWVRRAAHNDKELRPKAVEWFQKAASQGNMPAKELLSTFQKKGQPKMPVESGTMLSGVAP